MAEKYVTYKELPDIIKDAVKQALEEYEHECIMHLKPGDSEHVRDMVGAIREIGDGDLGRGIVKVRDNHKFMPPSFPFRKTLHIFSIYFLILA